MLQACRLSMFAVAYALQVGAAHADGDITLQQGKHFSLYASGNCKKVDVPQVDLMLECQFDGKQARFYLKEFPNKTAPAASIGDPRFDLSAEIERLTRLVLTGIDRDIGERIRLYGGSSGPTISSQYGFSYPSVEAARSHPIDARDKRVLVRSHSAMGGRGFETALLVVISDYDRANMMRNHGVPDEVITMFASLDLAPYRLPQL